MASPVDIALITNKEYTRSREGARFLLYTYVWTDPSPGVQSSGNGLPDIGEEDKQFEGHRCLLKGFTRVGNEFRGSSSYRYSCTCDEALWRHMLHSDAGMTAVFSDSWYGSVWRISVLEICEGALFERVST